MKAWPTKIILPVPPSIITPCELHVHLDAEAAAALATCRTAADVAETMKLLQWSSEASLPELRALT